MSASDILANMRRGWNRNPAGHVTGAHTGVSAAVWTEEAGGVHEVWADPDPSQHIVCLQLASYDVEMMIDDRLQFAKHCRPGLMMVVRAGDCPRAVIKGAFSVLHVYVPNAMLAAQVQEGAASGAAIELRRPDLLPDRGIEAIGREIRSEIAQGAPLSRLRVDALGQDLGIQLLRRHSNLAGTPGMASQARGGLAPWQVRRACEAMEAQLDGEVGLATLAALAGVSPTHFSRAFKQSTGLPPFAWLQRRRIERAQDLLADPRLSLAEVALAVGFSAQPQFTTAFRRVTGMTPGAWRRERLR